MATPINAPMAGEIWHLSIEDLFQPVQEAPRLGGNGPFVINLSASTAPISIPTKAFTACWDAHVYQIQVTEDGRTRYRLRLGPFLGEDEADAVLAEVRDTYPGALTATAGAADLRVIANMQAKADARQSVARSPAQKPPAEKVAAIRLAADEPTTEGADAEIPLDIAWPTPGPVVPPLLPRAAAAASPQAAAPRAALPKPVAPQAVAPMVQTAPAPVPTEVAAPVKAATPATVAPATVAPATVAPATVAPVPVPIAAPVLTDAVALKPKAPPALPAAAAETAAAQKAAMEKAAVEKAAAQKAAMEKAAVEKAAAQKAAVEKAAVEKAAMEKVAAEKAAMEKAAMEKAATEKAAAEKAAAEKAATEKAAAEKAATEKAAAEKAATEKAAMEKVAAEKAAAEKAAAEKAAAEKAAVEKAAAQKAAAEKAAAQKAAVEKAAVEKAAATLKAPSEKPMQVLRQSVASPLKAFAKKMRPSVIIPPTRLTSLQHVVVATAPVPAAREVKKLDEPLDSLESTQTMRALTANELEDTEASRWFVIQLAVADRAFDPDAVPNLDIFSEYRLYSVAGNDQGRVAHALRLGFFREEIAAVAVASYLGAFWDKPTIKRVSLAERERFADQRVEARKDVGATGRHAVIEITDELVARRRRAIRSTAPSTTSNPI
jgi:chemotaxis protein histidine kinase CheA